ncbi:hypothetical protein KCM76_12410 [Zooshikella marina]|uniref:hypothetical protein n=1 Tax=Zooshikella ganghwensis TaxID=202772 RepID=UPI001BAE9B52|nr:hypothetical protein [Zooshikella ganghwensis]MBU2706788.1 hypothetical protein [Zooshikella ganghwensis]
MIYPVILKNKFGAIVHANYKSLTTCGEQWARQGKMTGAVIIDSNLNQYEITNTTIISNANFLPSFLVAEKNRIAHVEFDTQESGRIELADLKKQLIELLKSEPDTCVEIESSKDFKEVCESLSFA